MRPAETLATGDGLSPVPLPRSSGLPLRRLRLTWRVLRRNPLALVGATIVTIFLIMAIFGPIIAPYSPYEATGRQQEPPSWAHLFGTDNYNRDVFSRVLVGSRDII